MKRAPYQQAKVTSGGWLNPSLESVEWLGPREIGEAYPWPMLSIGGNYSAATPPHIVEAAERAAAHPPYPDTLGLRALREAIASTLGSELRRHIDPDSEVLITVGSMQALYLAARVCTNSDRAAVAHAPAFFYRDLVAAAGARLRWSGGHDGAPDWESFGAEARRPEVSLAIVNTPCNPTGYVFLDSDLDALEVALAGTSCWLVSDEAMMSYVYDGRRHMSPGARPSLAERTLVVRSFSKMYAMGPWRLGFAVGPAAIIAAMAKLLQWSVIAVDGVAQAAALAALTGPQQWVADTVAELAERRVQVLRALNASEILEAALPQAGAVLWARITDPGWNEAELSLALGREFGIPAVRGSLFGAAEPHLRIPFGGERDAIRDLVQRLPRVPPKARSDPA